MLSSCMVDWIVGWVIVDSVAIFFQMREAEERAERAMGGIAGEVERGGIVYRSYEWVKKFALGCELQNWPYQENQIL